MTRIPSHLIAGALVRRVHDAGGSAMILARGERIGGMILVLALERGENPRFLERGLGADGSAAIVAAGPPDLADPAEVTGYWQRRRARDPDLWVIEVDVAAAERFVDETMLND